MSPYKYTYYFNLHFLPNDIEEYSKLLQSRKIEKYVEKSIIESLDNHKNEITDFTSQIIKFDSIDFDYQTESTRATDVFIINLKSKNISKKLGEIVDIINDECINEIRIKFPNLTIYPGITRSRMNNK